MPADDQPLEVQLERDAQVQVDVERVVVGDERARRRAALDRLQHRALDLGEPLVLEVVADCADRGVPDPEDLAGAGVGLQVDVALAVAGLGVGEAAPLVGRGQLGLRQQREAAYAHRELTAPGGHHDALDADPVAAVHRVEVGVDVRADDRRVDEELKVAGAVAQHREGEAALAPDQRQAARDPNEVAGDLIRGQVAVRRPDLRDAVVGRVAVGVVPVGRRPVSGRRDGARRGTGGRGVRPHRFARLIDLGVGGHATTIGITPAPGQVRRAPLARLAESPTPFGRRRRLLRRPCVMWRGVFRSRSGGEQVDQAVPAAAASRREAEAGPLPPP